LFYLKKTPTIFGAVCSKEARLILNPPASSKRQIKKRLYGSTALRHYGITAFQHHGSYTLSRQTKTPSRLYAATPLRPATNKKECISHSLYL
jgi:hypothetical protein